MAIPKKFTLKNRICIESFLLFFFFLNFGKPFTGMLVHKVAGSLLFFLIAIHLYAGRAWFFSLFKKKLGTKQWVPLLLKFSLAFAFLFLFASAFAILFIENSGLVVRQVHKMSAYWLLLLLGAHVGLYWDRVRMLMSPLPKIFHTLFFFFIHTMALYGVYAWFEIDLFEKLFRGAFFQPWDDSKPTLLFFLPRIALLCLSGVFVRYSMFFFGKRKTT